MPDRALIVVLAVAALVLVGRTVAPRLPVPEAVLLVLLGIAVSFVPGLPSVDLSPQLVFLGFLPPLVYHAGFFTAPRETWADAVPIAVLAVGLVAATAVLVAVVAHLLIPGFSWPVAFLLGAAVAPTDPVAATSVLRRLGAPPRLVTILEGESLANDGVALTIFAVALIALSGPLTPAGTVIRLLLVSAGGLVYGLAVGWAVSHLRRRVQDAGTQIVVSLLTPYLAYIPADRLHLSGVLATVAAGLFLGARGQGLFPPTVRLQATAVWDVLTFLLESTLFVLLGLQARTALGGAAGHGGLAVLGYAAAVVAVVVVVRLLWQFLTPARVFCGIPPRTNGAPRDPIDLRQRTVLGWSGLRGGISLAAALAVPANLSQRGLVVTVTGAVVLVTLVGQATTLPALLRLLRVGGEHDQAGEEAAARQQLVEAALRRLDELSDRERVDEDVVAALRRPLETELTRLRSLLGEDTGHPVDLERRLRRGMLDAQRERVQQLYRAGRIRAQTARTLQQDLDLTHARLQRDRH